MKQITRKVSARLFLVFGAMFVLFCSMPAEAQSSNSASAENSSGLEAYDVTREVKIQGTIQQIDNSGERAPLGTHLLIATAQGVIDAHLGALNAASRKILNLSAGQAVELTGMIETENGNSVMLARLMTTPTHVVILRNENGIPIHSLVRASGAIAPSSTQKGGL